MHDKNCNIEHGSFQPSLADRIYRKYVKESIDNSKLGIDVIGTNLFSLKHSDILDSLRRARDDGVAVSIYFNEASEDLIVNLIDSDIELYQGHKKFLSREYFIVDGFKLIVSKVKDGEIYGEWTKDEYQIIDLIKKYDSLITDQDTTLISPMQVTPTEGRYGKIRSSEVEIKKRIIKYREPSEKEKPFARKIINALNDVIDDPKQNVILAQFKTAFEYKKQRPWLAESKSENLPLILYNSLNSYHKSIRLESQYDEMSTVENNFKLKLKEASKNLAENNEWINAIRENLQLEGYDVDNLELDELKRIVTLSLGYYGSRKKEGISIDNLW